MAHVAKLGALTDELITTITAFTSSNYPSRFTRLKEQSLRSLRSQNYARTDQFDCKSQLNGLVEKFSVHDKDDVAEALQERLKTLKSFELKWEFEILHLLLALSERPVANADLESLNSLKAPEPEPEPPLRWKDLIAEKPSLRDKYLWRNVDFGGETSDDDEFEDTRSEGSETTTVISSVDEGAYTHPENFTVELTGNNDLVKLRKAQFWLKAPSVGGVRLETVKKPITELQSIRETLFMLSGFPTSLFELQPGKSPVLQSRENYKLNTLTPEGFSETLKSLADIGCSLHLLRAWVQIPQSVPLLQIFQSTILERLTRFDQSLSLLQQQFVGKIGDIVVSLLSIRAELVKLARPLVRLSSVLSEYQKEPYAHSFRYLELIYDVACVSQMAGDEAIYEFMATIFFECFQFYLSPLRVWMEEGEIDENDKVFFVLESTGQTDIASIWQTKYRLRQSKTGVLHAPSFLHAASSKIFITGKSVMVLKRLQRFSLLRSKARIAEPVLDFATVCSSEKFLAPFPELFEAAFDGWVQNKHHHASNILRGVLFESCGLINTLSALKGIYFMSDGASSSVFSNSIFEKLDTSNMSWKDHFMLTEHGQTTFGSLSLVSSDKLRVKFIPTSLKRYDTGRYRQSVKGLAAIEVSYQLTWPLQVVIRPESMTLYKRIFSFLLQIQRSTQILSRQRLLKDDLAQTSGSDERSLYYLIRTRLLWFNHALYHYLTAIVLEVRSRRLGEELGRAEDVDAMIDIHATFIKLAHDQALLGSRLEPIRKTILRILDLGIKLEDAQVTNVLASKQALEQQQELMDMSMGSLGLHTPRKGKLSIAKSPASKRPQPDSDLENGEDQAEIDLSIMSAVDTNMTFLEQLRKMKLEFDRMAHFVANGLKGVARAGGGEEAKSWDLLGEMLMSGLDPRSRR